MERLREKISQYQVLMKAAYGTLKKAKAEMKKAAP